MQLILWKNREKEGSVKLFCVDFNPVDTNNVLDVHRYLMKEKSYKIKFGVLNKYFCDY